MRCSGFKGLFEQAGRFTIRHLCWIDRITRQSPRRVLGWFIVLVLVSLALLRSIHFETDIFRLFPADRPALRLLLDSLEWSGGAKEAYFLLEGEPEQLPLEAAALAQRLRSMQVDGAPAFKRVVYRMFEESEALRFTDLVSFAARHPAAFVALQDGPALAERLCLGSMISEAVPCFSSQAIIESTPKGGMTLKMVVISGTPARKLLP